MKKLHRIKDWIVNKVDLPPDTFLDLPRITMVGQIHIYIENHRGLLQFSESEIRIALKQGQLLIKGNELVIRAILSEELLVEGTIHNVIYINE
ncbi:MAG: sporulation protein YqfC [Bacillaceae bacterium]